MRKWNRIKTCNIISHFLNTIVLVPSDEEDGDWLAKIPDLPGCITFGDTKEEALEMIDDARIGWITHSFEEGYPIPEPQKSAV